jgi:glycosyltransferase involved in cell wall biosynthesis
VRVTPGRPTARVAEVTAVIPCYNYGRYLPDAVASVLDQRGVSARVIVVDDCSTDDSLAVAHRLAAADPRITVIEHAQNAGHIATYNDGLERVETEYVTLVSADDLVAPGAFERATALMNAHRRVGMVYGQPVEFVDVAPASDRDGFAPYTWTRWRGSAWIRLASSRGRCFILSPEVVMRTDAMRQIGGYNPQLPKSGDLEYWLRTAACWEVGRVNGRVQAFYRQHASNMHTTVLSSMAADYRHRLLAFQYLESGDFRATSLDGPALVKRARRALAREAIGVALRDLDAHGPSDEVEDLRSVAIEISAEVARTRRFRALEARLHGSGGSSMRLRAFLRSLADRARWRFWVYTGVS